MLLIVVRDLVHEARERCESDLPPAGYWNNGRMAEEPDTGGEAAGGTSGQMGLQRANFEVAVMMGQRES